MMKRMTKPTAVALSLALLIPVASVAGKAEVASADPIVADSTWRAIDTTMAVASGSALDLSFLNDAPAGDKGFVQIDADGDYVFEEEPAKKVKFYGGNLNGSYGTDPTHAEMVVIADRLAAMGYNVVRYSSVDQNYDWAKGLMAKPTSTTVTLNAAKLDNFEYFNALLKARGIYIDMDILAYADFSGVSSLNIYGATASKYLATLMPDGIAIWKSFANQLLSHVNPYTGLALKDDPQLMGLSPVNESLLYNASFSDANFNNWIKTDFNAYLTGKGLPTVSTFPTSFWGAPSGVRDLMTAYFTEKQFAANGDMKSYLKNVVGVRAPIGGINYINDSLANYWRTQADVQETHLYNGLVNGRGVFSYNPLTHPRYSTVFDPATASSYAPQYGSSIIKNYIPALALGQLYRKPFALTEFNQEFPTDGRDELGLISSATGAFNGWDMMNRFDFSSRVNEAVNEAPLGGAISFDSVTDTLATMSEYQSALLFRRGHVAESEPKFVIVRDKNWVTTHGSATENQDQERNRMMIPHLFKTVTVYADHPAAPYTIYKITPDLTPAEIAAGDIPSANEIAVTNAMTMKEVAETFIDALDDAGLKASMQDALDDDLLVSDTGELVFDLNTNTYLINTPYAAAAVGTLDDSSFELGAVTLKGDLAHGTVSALSLDDEPLDESGRILLSYTTDAAGTGEYEETSGGLTTYHQGTLPTLVKYGLGEFKLDTTRTPSAYKAYKLAQNGVRLAEVPVTVTGTTISVPLETDKGYAFELVYDPVTGTDLTAPTAPSGVAAVSDTAAKVALSWTKSTDNVGVSGYKIYRDGAEIASLNGNVTHYADKSVTGLTTYHYVVKAFDPSGNISAGSGPTAVTTSDLLFKEQFESGTAAGWTVASSWGNFSVVANGGSYVYLADNFDKGGSKSTAGEAAWTNYSVEAKIKADQWQSIYGRIGLVARFADKDNYYYVYYDNNLGQLTLRKVVGGTESIVASASLTLSTGTQHLFKLEVNGTAIKAYVNGTLKINATDASLASGKIGVYTHFAQAYFDDVVVKQV
ncbi:fibronectin type III domain-containing protein [Cohnella sp. JJ-181]|uniref:fibronectin type III domain-containing protein n=1 Tax=Cohnella rhizoplanae TaxID=2974897 RepID=UPI0022FFC390|nr:fibronectin type III domain-containing protein [Cohnella sp. JJ-181]CAI6067220.1 hypothetical protein COHCIP112018_02131 [Cohnella sp. JJ-181]